MPLTFVPSFPTFPPEMAWMRQPTTNIPALVMNSQIAYLPADIDSRYARYNLPDHGTLLANLVRWAAGDRIGFQVQGAGLIDCHLYWQSNSLIVHLVNLTNEGAWRGPIDELIPVGPLQIRIKAPSDFHIRKVESLVSRTQPPLMNQQGWITVEVKQILDHEVLVLS